MSTNYLPGPNLSLTCIILFNLVNTPKVRYYDKCPISLPEAERTDSLGREWGGREGGKAGNKEKRRQRSFIRKGVAMAIVMDIILFALWEKSAPPASPWRFLQGNPTSHGKEWSAKTCLGNACNATPNYFSLSFQYNPKCLCSWGVCPFSWSSHAHYFGSVFFYFNKPTVCLALFVHGGQEPTSPLAASLPKRKTEKHRCSA